MMDLHVPSANTPTMCLNADLEGTFRTRGMRWTLEPLWRTGVALPDQIVFQELDHA